MIIYIYIANNLMSVVDKHTCLTFQQVQLFFCPTQYACVCLGGGGQQQKVACSDSKYIELSNLILKNSREEKKFKQQNQIKYFNSVRLRKMGGHSCSEIFIIQYGRIGYIMGFGPAQEMAQMKYQKLWEYMLEVSQSL